MLLEHPKESIIRKKIGKTPQHLKINKMNISSILKMNIATNIINITSITNRSHAKDEKQSITSFKHLGQYYICNRSKLQEI